MNSKSALEFYLIFIKNITVNLPRVFEFISVKYSAIKNTKPTI